MICSKKQKLFQPEQEKIDVLNHQKQNLKSLESKTEDVLSDLESSISYSEKMLEQHGIDLNTMVCLPDHSKCSEDSIVLRSWDEILSETIESIDCPALMTDLLSPEEIQLVEQKIHFLRGEFDAVHKLDKLDWTICGSAGILATLVDVLLIQMPKHPGFLGGKASEGGHLANWIRERINHVVPPEYIAKLEKGNWVPYDPAHSANLSQKVDGLGPGTHRFQSLGHDPVLGFIFGVKDILMNTFTTIDRNGKLIIQNANMTDPSTFGMNVFEAIGRVFGHLKSDIATPRGLPAPLMPLFQFLQFGEIGRQGHTVGEVARIMYRSGYDFRHFLSMSISPLLIEVLVRLLYFAKRMHEGCELVDAIPLNLPLSKQHPKLRTMLFSAHLIGSAANAGKVAIGRNPLMINYPQWLAFFRYAIPHLKWVLLDKENKRYDYIQNKINVDWDLIDHNLRETWDMAAMKPIILS